MNVHYYERNTKTHSTYPGWKSRRWSHMISHVISLMKSHEFHELNHMNFTHLITWNPIWNHMRSYEDFGLRRCENVWVNKYEIIWANLYLKYTNIHTNVRKCTHIHMYKCTNIHKNVRNVHKNQMWVYLRDSLGSSSLKNTRSFRFRTIFTWVFLLVLANCNKNEKYTISFCR